MAGFDFDDDDILGDNPLQPDEERGLNDQSRLVTYGTLHKKKVPSAQVMLKIPTDVINFVDTNMEPGANKTLIYAKMLEIGAAYLRKQLILGDFEIKY